MLKILENIGVKGILSVCPYYNRPDQRGIFEHFKNISQNTDLDIVLYNIPYRTGTNIENETIYKLSEFKNIIGLKDCSGNMKQTLSLLEAPPKNFSIMTGEDSLFYTTLVNGGQGGILASAHLNTEKYINIYNLIQENNHKKALEEWKSISSFIPLLFGEPNPAPVKYCLNKLGIIDSQEVRLPLVEISDSLKDKINPYLFSIKMSHTA
jgi:4-hydroxy-tetrahydrodipicolinate synthase